MEIALEAFEVVVNKFWLAGLPVALACIWSLGPSLPLTGMSPRVKLGKADT